MDSRRPKVLLIGDCGFHEFSDAVQWLETHTELDTAATLADALERGGANGWSWHTVVLAQSRPGQFGARAIEAVNRVAPLTHLVALLGSCCEGEPRVGQPWPGVVRVYWHQWRARCDLELRLDSTPTSWQLPRTSSAAERTDYVVRHPSVTHSGLVTVFTRHASRYYALAQACRIAGYSVAWRSSERGPGPLGTVAILWDGRTLDQAHLDQLHGLVALAQGAPVIALLGFPRYEDVRRARQCGAAAVLSVPFLLPDLWSTLRAAQEPMPKNQ